MRLYINHRTGTNGGQCLPQVFTAGAGLYLTTACGILHIRELNVSFIDLYAYVLFIDSALRLNGLQTNEQFI